MKKLAALMTAAMVLTVGGVYATWSYAQDDIAPAQFIYHPVMGEVKTDSAMGVIAINAETFSMTIDAQEGTHNAVLNFEGEINVTFTPNTGAPENVMNNGIIMTYTLSCTDSATWVYNTTPIIEIKDSATTTKTLERSKSFTITAAEIANIFELGGAFTLDSYQEYLDFQTALHRGNIKLTVSHVEHVDDGVVVQPNP